MSLTSRLLVLTTALVLAPGLASCSGGIRFERAQDDTYSCVAATSLSKCRIEREKRSIAPTDRGGRP